MQQLLQQPGGTELHQHVLQMQQAQGRKAKTPKKTSPASKGKKGRRPSSSELEEEDNHVDEDASIPFGPDPSPSSRSQNRHRSSRINGADIYVVRLVKDGMGKAYPCTRCIEWCRWAGVKRIFHWDPEVNAFLVVKVNGTEAGYETLADLKMMNGMFV